ncbi:MAG: transcriptional repressor [Pseudomonadota bacterium]
MSGQSACADIAEKRALLLAPLGKVPREVVGLLLAAETPLKPYDLLWRLQSVRGRPAPPSTIYRALKVLVDAGLVHRIGMVGAYALCAAPGERHQPAFLVCDHCAIVSEVDAVDAHRHIARRIKGRRFACDQVSIVLRGACARCQAAMSR